MIRIILERALAALGVMLGISGVTFALTNLAPGDPAYTLLEMQNGGVAPTREAVAAYRTQLGLDDPMAQRYVRWLRQALAGDLGISYRSGRPVGAELVARMPATIQLAALSMAVAIAISLPLGIASALWRGAAIDMVTRLLALAGATAPSYLVSLALIMLFAVALGVLPAFGYGAARHFVLPTLTLAFGVMPQLARLTRASLLDVLGHDYVRTARAKGLTERTILLRHVLRQSLPPIVTAIGLSAGGLLSGTVIVESIFGWAGIGKYAVDAIFLRDYPVIQGVVLYMTFMYVVVNTICDIVCNWLDPRLDAAATPV